MDVSLNPDRLLMLLFVLYHGYLIKFLMANDAEEADLFRVLDNVSLMRNLALLLVATNAWQPLVGWCPSQILSLC